jgi:hypothetical protein
MKILFWRLLGATVTFLSVASLISPVILSPLITEAATPNLVAAYGFNETSGTTATDSSGLNNSGTLNGATRTATAKFGNALSFNGTSNYVSIPDASSLDLTTGMTLEAWVRPSNLTGWKTVMVKERSTSFTYALSANNNNTTVANQRPDARVRTNGSTKTITGTSKLALNTWTHIATTYDGATFKLFINGVQVQSSAVTGLITTTTNPLDIGGSPVLGQYFTGQIDEVRIYNRALTTTEIQTDMNTPVQPPTPDTIAPTVSLTAPADGASVLGTVAVSANSTDNVGVSGVQFNLDGNNLGTEDTSAPYSVSWNSTTVADGSHTLLAVSRDAAGNRATSTPVTVTVANADTVAPTISITSPIDGGTATGTIQIAANASDNRGVVGIQFAVDGINLGAEDTTSPYGINWNTALATNDIHTITARARDAAGNVSTSTISVTVNNPIDTTAPSVSVTSPTDGATIIGTATLSANATDDFGVVGVQFQVDGLNVGTEDTTSPYSMTWNSSSVADGPHTITAFAHDAAGNYATSSVATITVQNTDITAPTVSLTAPANGATVSGVTAVSASASDDRGVIGVQFSLDGLNLSTEDTTSPYGVSWNTASSTNGAHTLSARARDAAGNTSTSTVSVTVNNFVDTQAPTVSISSPINGSVVAGTLSVTASSTDNVGVTGVQFKLDGANLGTEDLTSPYSVSWNSTGVSNGSHTLLASFSRRCW